VISSDAVGILPIKLVAPLTDWKLTFASKIWLVRINPDSTNGLSKPSAVDMLQVRGVDTQRFIQRLGAVPADVMEEIVLALGAVIEMP
jgi:mRNA interferase MazF